MLRSTRRQRWRGGRPHWRRALYPGPRRHPRAVSCAQMLEEMRKYMRAGLEAVAAGRSQEVSASVASGAQSIAEQMSALAAGFLEWSAEARASLLREVKDLVARQVREMGLASQRDLDALKDRVAR